MNDLISIAPLYGEHLEHHQIKGAKWGVLHGPPYPLARGKNGRIPKIKKITSEAKQRAAERKAEKAVKKAEKNEKNASDKKEQLKKTIISNPSLLRKNKDIFTKSELEEIMKEIEFDRRLKDVEDQEFKRLVSKGQDISNLFGSVAKIGSSAMGIYNTAVGFHNAFSDGPEWKPAGPKGGEVGKGTKSSKAEAKNTRI